MKKIISQRDLNDVLNILQTSNINLPNYIIQNLINNLVSSEVYNPISEVKPTENKEVKK